MSRIQAGSSRRSDSSRISTPDDTRTAPTDVNGGRGTILGYRITAQLGSGARTKIYRVVDRAGREYALKHLSIRSDSDKRFLIQMSHEHSVARRLSHPGIRQTKRLRVRRRWFRPVEAGLVMELVEGESLDQHPKSSLAKTIEQFHQIAEALTSMHRLAWVHADIKPTNVICSPDGAVLIDLGQAARSGTAKSRVQGTPGFMAPEQVVRDTITPRTDVFGFGATLYWVLAGTKVPTVIGGGVAERVAGSIANLDPPHAATPLKEVCPDVPDGLSELLMQCTASNPRHRPSGMEEVIGALTRLRTQIATKGASP